MANKVSKLKFNNVTYDLADESSRAALNNLEGQLEATRVDLNNMRAAVGSPLTAATTSAMTDTNKIYVYTGTTTTVSGVTFTAGNWYYHDGTKWQLGGTYNETALETDTTLTVSGAAADAKVTGDKVTELKSALNDTQDKIKRLDNGIGALDGNFVIGNLDKTTVYPNNKYTVCNPTIQQYDRDIVFTIKPGFKINVNFFDSEGERTATYNNRTGTFTVPKDTRFNLSIRRNPEDTSEVITDINEFVDAVTFDTVIEERISNLEGLTGKYSENFDDIESDVTFDTTPLEYGSIENGTGIIKKGTSVRTRNYIKAYAGDVVMATYTNYAGNTIQAQLNGYEYDALGNLIGGAVAGWKNSYEVTTDCNLMIVFNNNLYDMSSTARLVSPSVFSDVVTLDYVRNHYVLDGKSIDLRSNQTIQDMKETFVSDVVKTIAHRGDDLTAPQCTAPSYITARKRGIKIAENDVFRSSDGVYVMWHDPTLYLLGNLVDINGYEVYTDGSVFYYYNASTNKLYTYNQDYVESSVSLSSLTRCVGSSYSVETIPFATLKRIDFGVYKNVQYAGTQILTFDEWVLLCKQLGMELYIDTKLTYTDSILEDLFATVQKYGMVNFASWMNIPFGLTTKLRTLDPQARIGILSNPTSDLITAYSPYNIGRGCFFVGNATTLTQNAAAMALAAGIPVECYYVDFGAVLPTAVYNVIRTVVSYGVSGITTDHYTVDEAFRYLLN